MSNKEKNNILGALVLISGIVIGAASAILYKESRPMEPNKVLNQIKETYSGLGEVVGSWIDYDPVEFHGFDSKPLVYIGGITRIENGNSTHYSFAADIYTGDILNTYVID